MLEMNKVVEMENIFNRLETIVSDLGKREKEPRVFSLQFIEYIDAINWRFFHERIKTKFEYLFFFC